MTAAANVKEPKRPTDDRQTDKPQNKPIKSDSLIGYERARIIGISGKWNRIVKSCLVVIKIPQECYK